MGGPLCGPVVDSYSRYLHARARGREELVAAHHRPFVNEATMQEASPQLILERGEPVELPPALFIHGADEDILAPRTAERFVEAYGHADGIVELATFPRAGHGYYVREDDLNTARSLDPKTSFVARQLTAIRRGW